jgi:hypothetical protein
LINTIDYELVLCLSSLFKLVFICEEFWDRFMDGRVIGFDKLFVVTAS